MSQIGFMDGGPVTCDLTDTLESPSATSHSISVNTGAPSSRKFVLIAATYSGAGSADASLASVTLGGQAMVNLRHDELRVGTSIAPDPCVALFLGQVTSVSQNLTAVFNATGGAITLRGAVYRVTNLLSPVPIATAGGYTADSGDVAGLSLPIDAVEGGLVFAAASGFNTNPAAFSQGVTNLHSQYNGLAASGAHLPTADEAGRTVTFARTTSSSIFFAMSVVSLR